jgi:hypothetical protein
MALSKVNPNFVSQLGRRNLIINGDMRIAQRGTGAFTANSSYPVDRWNMISNVTDFTTTQDSAVPTGKGFTNSIKIQPTATKSPSASTYSRIGYSIEGYDGVSLCWGTSGAKTATISFWVKSSVTGTYSICVKNGAANKSVVQDYTISVADTWEYKTITIPPETSGTWDSVNGRFAYIDVWLAGQGSQTSTTGSWISSNANMSNNQVNFFSSTSNTFNITGFQLEVGDTATPFEHRSYGEELAACQRYFQKSKTGTPTQNSFGGHQIHVASGQDPQSVVYLHPTMRTTPTLTLYSAHGSGTSGQWYGAAFNNGFSGNARAFGQSSRQFLLDNTDVGANTNGWAEIGWTAESEL